MLYDSIAQQNHINVMMKRFFLLKPPRLLFEPTEIDDRDAVKRTLNGFTRAPVIVGAIGLLLQAAYVAFCIWTYFHR
jgi:hypothetical protein